MLNANTKLTNYAEAINRAENLGNKRCLYNSHSKINKQTNYKFVKLNDKLGPKFR